MLNNNTPGYQSIGNFEEKYIIEYSGNIPSINKRFIEIRLSEDVKSYIIKNANVKQKNFKLHIDNNKYYQFINSFKKAIKNKYGNRKTIDLCVEIFISVYLKHDIDTDNIIKPICDAIVDSKLIHDDLFINKITVNREYNYNINRNSDLILTIIPKETKNEDKLFEYLRSKSRILKDIIKD